MSLERMKALVMSRERDRSKRGCHHPCCDDNATTEGRTGWWVTALRKEVPTTHLTQGSKNNVQCFSPVLLLNKDLGRENLEYGVWSRKGAECTRACLGGGMFGAEATGGAMPGWMTIKGEGELLLLRIKVYSLCSLL